MKSTLTFLALCAGVLVAQAAGAPDLATERAERDRIGAERSQAEAAFAAREQECRERFAVTACLDAARRERRAALDRLRVQQDVLDEADRKRRAAQRVEEIRNNVSAEEAKRRDIAERQRLKAKQQAEAASTEAVAVSAPAAPASRAGRPAAVAHRKASAPDPRRAQEYEQRQTDAKAHREAVVRRNAERAAKGKPAKPLPTPGAASAPT
jgi:colicin import membrane protein